jgi:hypothetical protein
MPDWLSWAAFCFNLGSALAWWAVTVTLARRDRKRWERWQRREDEQIMRWAHVERCSACSAWLNEYNGRLAARGLDDDA